MTPIHHTSHAISKTATCFLCRFMLSSILTLLYVSLQDFQIPAQEPSYHHYHYHYCFYYNCRK